MKLGNKFRVFITDCTAAFRRLCVETKSAEHHKNFGLTAAFRRLCVETMTSHLIGGDDVIQPPSGGCVLKRVFKDDSDVTRYSRLQAAVC